MKDRPHSLLAALRKMILLLNRAKGTLGEVKVFLPIVGAALEASQVSLYRRRCDEGEPNALTQLGSWENPQSRWEPPPLEPASEAISASHWAQLEQGQRVQLCCHGDGLAPVRFLSPLFLENHLFGLLAVALEEALGQSEEVTDFTFTVCGLIELWISRINLAKRLGDVIDFIPTPTFLMGKDGVIEYWNRSTEELTGWTADRIVGKGKYEHAIPFYGFRRPTVSNLIIEPNPGWERTYPEFRRVDHNVFVIAYCPSVPGGGAYLDGKTSMLHDLDGWLWGSIHNVRDITRERQIEKSLHRSESMYRGITDFADMGIMVFGTDQVFYHNERVLGLLGISGRPLTLEDIKTWFHPDDRDRVLGTFQDLFKKYRDPFRFEFRAAKGGELRHYTGYVQAMDYEGRPTIHFIVDDITEQKELARKARLNELRMYHEDRLTALGTMAAGMAHELNQPLNTIRVVTDGFLFGREAGWVLDPEEWVEGLEMVSRQVVRMSEVIQNIRNFARDDQAQTFGEVNANEAIENVFSMMGRQLEAHGIRVYKELERRLPLIRTHLNRLEQVVMNLLVNARQALDHCSHPHKEIRVRSGRRDGNVFIEVSDNGTGVPEEIIGKIFDPFFTTKEVGKGTGLGLSISQSIVAELRGRIEVFNNEMGGATFVVTAPIKEARA
jgi:PAS domain S-box-containing protein